MRKIDAPSAMACVRDDGRLWDCAYQGKPKPGRFTTDATVRIVRESDYRKLLAVARAAEAQRWS